MPWCQIGIRASATAILNRLSHFENNTNMSLYHWWQLSCDNFISTTGFIYWIKPKQHPCWPDVKWNTSYFPEIMRFIYLSCGIYISSAPGGGININIPDRNWYIKCTSNNNLNSVHYVPTAWHLPLPNNMTRARPSAEPKLIQCQAITITNADSVPSHHYNQCWFRAKPSAEPMLIQCQAITITNADSVPSHHYNQCWFRTKPSAEPMLIQCQAITITNADSVPSHHYNQCWFSAKPSL